MQISGAWSAELPIERVARLVAAEIIEYIGRPEVLDAIGAALAARMSAEAGGYPLYDRESEGGGR